MFRFLSELYEIYVILVIIDILPTILGKWCVLHYLYFLFFGSILKFESYKSCTFLAKLIQSFLLLLHMVTKLSYLPQPPVLLLY